MSNHPVQTVTTSSDKLKVALAVGAVIAGVVGFYFLSDKSTLVRVGCIAGAVCWLRIAIALDFDCRVANFIGFANESVRETKKVVWPKRKEAMQMTAIVFGFVLVMAIFLWGTDKLLEFLLYDFDSWLEKIMSENMQDGAQEAAAVATAGQQEALVCGARLFRHGKKRAACID